MSPKKTKKKHSPSTIDPEHAALNEALNAATQPDAFEFSHAWAGIEPTFSNKKAVRKWQTMSATEEGEDEYFDDAYMQRTARDIARAIEKRYCAQRKQGDAACVFSDVEHEQDVDQWKVKRQNLRFSWRDARSGTFEVRLGLDPETFEFSIKPVPIAWFYDPRFVRFLQQFVWDVPQSFGLRASIAHGGGQFSLSAKTYLQGSLLADDIASRLDHPELATWMMDYPNPDDRAFRATNRRRAAFERVLASYWDGGFHPRAIGTLTVENALLDRGFGAHHAPPAGLVDVRNGPIGTPGEIFRNNFAFGRSVRLEAQNVDPGYWQSAHPDHDGYRPDQIMRYSEGNLNRLQIAGELHVKSGKVLDARDVHELDAPLERSMLYDEASWEIRAQMSRTSAADFVEALLLDVHHAQWLQDHPHVRVRSSLLQDQMLGDAERTLQRHAPKVLARLKRDARAENLEASGGRIKTDWIEPETLFWSTWSALPSGERAAIAIEAVNGFIERVENAASKDPRSQATRDPMQAHRHRVHPLLWKALETEPASLATNAAVRRELEIWTRDRKQLSAQRPQWSVTGVKAPWKNAS